MRIDSMHPSYFFVRAVIGLLFLLGLGNRGPAAEWTEKGGGAIEGELSGFDFGEKQVRFRKANGREHRVPAEELSPSSRWRLLASPEFARAFPESDWTSEQGRYLLLAVGLPCLCLLGSFYACALLFLKNGSPWKALTGWVGSALLGGFLMSFYIMLSGKSAGSATAVLIGGGAVSTWLMSFFIGIVYQTTTTNGFKVFALHLFGAFLFLLLVVLGFQKITESFDLEDLVADKIMSPVGLLPRE